MFAANTLAQAEIVSLDDGAISFEAPEGFQPLAKEVLDIKYPQTGAPKYVIGNASASTTIAYDLKPNTIPQGKEDEVRQAFTQMFPKLIPGLEWKENKVITLAGRQWGYMEMTSSAVDTDIYNIMLFTGYKEQMLIFNFNSTKDDFSTYEQALRKSVESIQIR